MLRILLILLLLAVPARAEMPADHDDPAFQAAVEAWLDGDDAVSLPELARLARDGSTAAQILLGRIWSDTEHFNPWIAGLARHERRAIFQASDRPLGHGWLAIAEESSELARAIRPRSYDPAEYASAIRDLTELGELRALLPLVLTLQRQNSGDYLVAAAVEGHVPRHLRIYVWQSALNSRLPAAEAVRDDLVRAIRSDSVEDLDAVYIQGFTRLEPNGFPPDVRARPETNAELSRLTRGMWFVFGRQSWMDSLLKSFAGRDFPPMDDSPDWMVDEMAELPAFRQIAETCRAICTDSTIECFRTAHSFIGGLFGQAFLGSPVETLIPQERYVSSARARLEVFHLLSTQSRRHQTAGGHGGAATFIEAMVNESACLAGPARRYHDELVRATKRNSEKALE